MNRPDSHSMATYGPVPTTGGWLAKNPSARRLPICSIVYSDQMCAGRIGTYACVSSVVENSVVATSVWSSSQVTASRPVFHRYGSR